MFADLTIPSITRATDYIGLWSIESTSASSLWSLAKRMDMPQHMATYSGPTQSRMEKSSLLSGGSVAVIPITGVLMKGETSLGGTSTIRVRRELRQAVADNDVRGILLAIDSPGGTVAGTDDLAREVREASKKKTVWSHVDDLCCSAAYWIASQAARVVANSPTALIGSIGTVQVMYDMSAAAEKEGVRTLVFSTGHLKGLGTPGTRITEEQANHMQQLVNTVQGSFDSAVLTGRNLSMAELGAVRHGGGMVAQDARRLRLIDDIAPMTATLRDMGRAITGGGGGLPTLTASGSLGRPPMRAEFPGVQPLASLPAAFTADPEFHTLVDAAKLIAELKSSGATGNPRDWPALDRAEQIHRQLQAEIWGRVGRA